jgi:hypothetical protein
MSGLDNEVEMLFFPAGSYLARAGESNTGEHMAINVNNYQHSLQVFSMLSRVFWTFWYRLKHPKGVMDGQQIPTKNEMLESGTMMKSHSS